MPNKHFNIVGEAKKSYREKHVFGKNLSKLDIARDLINSSIKMLFDDMSPIAVHTVVSSGYQIVRDLASKAQTKEYLLITDKIKEGHLGEFWSHINKAWRFFKHADNDSNVKFEGADILINDFAIFMSIRFYKSLNQKPSSEMGAFLSWFIATRPELLQDCFYKELLKNTHQKFNVENFSRREILQVGKQALNLPSLSNIILKDGLNFNE